VKPVHLGTPERDLGWAEIRPLAENLIQELERQAKKIQALERSRPGLAEPSRPGGLAEARRLLTNLAMRTADTVTLERQRVLHRALDEEYFRRDLAPGMVTYEVGAADAANGLTAVMRLPAAAAGTFPMLHRTCRMNALVARTRPRLTMWYTSTVGSTANFDLRFQVRLHAIGALTTAAGSLVFSTQLLAPGPAVANTILSATVVGGAIMPAIPAPVRLSVARIGGDPNVNALDILLAVVTFEEIA
jgi:hypothetical protein